MQHLVDILISNLLLSHFAWAYGGFGDIARATMALPEGVFINQKATADLLEAFVGAVMQESPNAFYTIVRWFRDVLTSGALPSVLPSADQHIVDEIARRYDVVERGKVKKKRRLECGTGVRTA